MTGNVTEEDIEQLAYLFASGKIDIDNISDKNIRDKVHDLTFKRYWDKNVDEDLTDLPPIPQKDFERISGSNLIPKSKKEKEIEMEKPGSFQRYTGGQRIEKIVKEEISKLLEDKNFRIKLKKKFKENKICPECQMPENACKHRDMSGPQGAKTLLDQEVSNSKFKMKEVAIVKDKKGHKHSIMKDSLGGISCDCNYYLKEHKILQPCKHIQAYLKKK